MRLIRLAPLVVCWWLVAFPGAFSEANGRPTADSWTPPGPPWTPRGPLTLTGTPLLPETTELIVDVDAGADDAMAILELLAAEELDDPTLTRTRVVAITCVAGNAPLPVVVRNVQAVLRAAGRTDIPVFAGAGVSLLHEVPTVDMYGEDGFGDFLPAAAGLDDVVGVRAEHAALALTRLARESPGRLSLLALAPLTNVALAQRLDPAFLGNLREVFVNGAAVRGGGNGAQPGREINVSFDPEAAFVVFNSTRRRISVLPSETVSELRVTKAWRRGVLGSVRTPQVRLLDLAERKVLDGRGHLWVNANGLMAAALLRPSIVRRRSPAKLLVATADGVARGATFADFGGGSGADNAVVLEHPDSEAFMALALRLLSAPPRTST